MRSFLQSRISDLCKALGQQPHPARFSNPGAPGDFFIRFQIPALRHDPSARHLRRLQSRRAGKAAKDAAHHWLAFEIDRADLPVSDRASVVRNSVVA